MSSSSSRVWPTQVRWAIGTIEVSRAIRPVTRTVVSREEPPAPYVTETKVGLVGLELADRRPQLLLAGLVLGRHELEGVRAAALADQRGDAEGRGAVTRSGVLRRDSGMPGV